MFSIYFLDPVAAFEFQIVSLDNKQWFFEAASAEERDAWVSAIESQILSSLQGNSSDKAKNGGGRSEMDSRTIRVIKGDVPGNLKCVDCDAPSKLFMTAYYDFCCNF